MSGLAQVKPGGGLAWRGPQAHSGGFSLERLLGRQCRGHFPHSKAENENKSRNYKERFGLSEGETFLAGRVAEDELGCLSGSWLLSPEKKGLGGNLYRALGTPTED